MGLIARVKTWIAGETLKAADVNAEFNNVLNNLTPAKLDDYSSTVAQMRETLDPGEEDSEVQPTNLAEEIKELRAMFKKIVGKTYWYSAPLNTIDSLNTAVGQNYPKNRVISGSVDGYVQENYLLANTNVKEVRFMATGTHFNYSVNLVDKEATTDQVLVVDGGYSTGQTATVKYPFASFDGIEYLGEEEGTKILLENVGQKFTDNIGKLCAFKTTNGGSTEYSIGFVGFDGVNTYLERCLRGYLFDYNFVARRVELAVSQVITILRLSYIFINASGVLSRNESLNAPIVSGSEPVAPTINDLWFDLETEIWKKYNGTIWVDDPKVFIGLCAQSSSACEAARPVEFYAKRSSVSSFNLRIGSETEIIAENISGNINVSGITRNYQSECLKFDTSIDMDTGTIDSLKRYFLYITEKHEPVISLIAPHNRTNDLYGFYRIDRPWRCIGEFETNPASEISTVKNYGGADSISNNSIGVEKLQKYFSGAGATTNQISSIDESFSIGNADILSSEISIRTVGRPVKIFFGKRSTSGIGKFWVQKYAQLQIQRKNNISGAWETIYDIDFGDGRTDNFLHLPTSSFSYIDSPTSGKNEYRVNFIATGADRAIAADISINAMEI